MSVQPNRKFHNIRDKDFLEYSDITIYDRTFNSLITIPYPTQKDGEPIQPSGIENWCERRGLLWECDCASAEKRACPVQWTGYLRSVAMCSNNPPTCPLHLDFKLLILTAKHFSAHREIKTLASIESDFNRVSLRRPDCMKSCKASISRDERRYSDAFRQLSLSPYVKPLDRTRLSAPYDTPPPNQLARGRRSSAPYKKLRCDSTMPGPSSGSASSSSSSASVLTRLETGWGIDDQEYMDLFVAIISTVQARPVTRDYTRESVLRDPFITPLKSENDRFKPLHTPRSRKMGSIPAIDHKTHRKDTDKLIKAELDPVTATEDTPTFLNNVLPKDSLPFEDVDVIVHNVILSSYDFVKEKWLFVPDMMNPGENGEREKEFAKFMQDLAVVAANNVPEAERPDLEREWTAEFASLPLAPFGKTNMKRKPDLLALQKSLIPTSATGLRKARTTRLNWQEIDLHAEIRTGHTSSFATLLMETASKVYCTFKFQWNRQFVITFCIYQFNCIASIYSRAGVVHCEMFNINNEPELFMHLLLGLTFGTADLIGFDTLFYTDNDTLESMIIFDDNLFTIVRPSYRCITIQGRATQCYILKALEGFHRVTKDVWIPRYRLPTELYFYRKANAAGVRNVPTLVCFVNIGIKKRGETCECGKEPLPLVDRIHRRYLFEECGVPIWEFRSQKEFLKALVDCLVAHADLFFKALILHRDISIWNLMLLDDPSLDDPSPDDDEQVDNKLVLFRSGLLIDYDYSSEVILGDGDITVDWTEANPAYLMPDEETNDSYAEEDFKHSMPKPIGPNDQPPKIRYAAENTGRYATYRSSDIPLTEYIKWGPSAEGYPAFPEDIFDDNTSETATLREPSPEDIWDEDDQVNELPIAKGKSDAKVDAVHETSPSEKEKKNRQRGQRTGTKPFMSWEIMQDQDTEHTIFHDLESFLYIFIYACVRYDGPGGSLNKTPMPEFLANWLFTEDYKTIGASKFGMINMADHLFKLNYTSHFSPYFKNLQRYANKIRLLFKEKRATHTAIIDILEEAIKTLPDVDPPAPIKKKASAKAAAKDKEKANDETDVQPKSKPKAAKQSGPRKSVKRKRRAEYELDEAQSAMVLDGDFRVATEGDVRPRKRPFTIEQPVIEDANAHYKSGNESDDNFFMS